MPTVDIVKPDPLGKVQITNYWVLHEYRDLFFGRPAGLKLNEAFDADPELSHDELRFWSLGWPGFWRSLPTAGEPSDPEQDVPQQGLCRSRPPLHSLPVFPLTKRRRGEIDRARKVGDDLSYTPLRSWCGVPRLRAQAM